MLWTKGNVTILDGMFEGNRGDIDSGVFILGEHGFITIEGGIFQVSVVQWVTFNLGLVNLDRVTSRRNTSVKEATLLQSRFSPFYAHLVGEE